MRVTAKVDYAVRAATVLAQAAAAGRGPMKGDEIGEQQGIPRKFLENILGEMRQAEILRSQRGAEGGYWLARPAEMITIADIIRAVEGPLANVRGERPDAVIYPETAAVLRDLWVAVRAALRSVLEQVTLADVAAGALPANVAAMLADPDAWRPH
ncbi:MAG: Rrf2 family transcriptional regulator [Acidimicrobiales bacterium]|nr:Rrf2 family transcriptional regulator [Acidimicrobiales bacterium]